jgi:hypothetical protein
MEGKCVFGIDFFGVEIFVDQKLGFLLQSFILVTNGFLEKKI